MSTFISRVKSRVINRDENELKSSIEVLKKKILGFWVVDMEFSVITVTPFPDLFIQVFQKSVRVKWVESEARWEQLIQLVPSYAFLEVIKEALECILDGMEVASSNFKEFVDNNLMKILKGPEAAQSEKSEQEKTSPDIRPTLMPPSAAISITPHGTLTIGSSGIITTGSDGIITTWHGSLIQPQLQGNGRLDNLPPLENNSGEKPKKKKKADAPAENKKTAKSKERKTKK